MTRLWEEIRLPLLCIRYLAWGPILWALDRLERKRP